MFVSIEEIKKYIHVSKYLDINTLKPYIATALSEKIYPLLSRSVVEKLASPDVNISQKTFIYNDLQKAVANYAIAYCIPFLKMQLSNTGANTYNDSKTERSPWWDIRDYGLNAVSIADFHLNNVIALLLKSELADELPIQNELQKSLFRSPAEFSAMYPIGNSYEIFLKLLPLMDDIWELSLRSFLSDCSVSDIKKDADALLLLKKYIAYVTLADAVLTQGFTFTTSGIVLQWEQLPWQKSQILPESKLHLLRQNFLEKAINYKNLLIAYMKKYPENFPCYADKNQVGREPVLKNSGIYF